MPRICDELIATVVCRDRSQYSSLGSQEAQDASSDTQALRAKIQAPHPIRSMVIQWNTCYFEMI